VLAHGVCVCVPYASEVSLLSALSTGSLECKAHTERVGDIVPRPWGKRATQTKYDDTRDSCNQVYRQQGACWDTEHCDGRRRRLERCQQLHGSRRRRLL
jgi:hypothetical protein